MSARPAAIVSAEDRRFMRLALRQAERGRHTERPNPVVGAVIVREGRVIARGHHRKEGGNAGESHAEVEALAALARRTGSLEAARGATLYVTLEPCCHRGHPDACTTALKEAGLARVVVGGRDPDPLVNGRGLRLLRRAGIRVDEGCLEEDCRALNRAFFMWSRERRPFVTLKLAATADGFLADGRRRARRAPAWITGPAARAEVHRLRAAQDAVLVGAGTVEADDPLLTVRSAGKAESQGGSRGLLATGKEPLRVVVDGAFRLSPRAQLFGSGGLAPLVITSRTALLSPAGRRKAAILRPHAEVEALAGKGTTLRWRAVLAALGAREVQSVLVEGGAQVAGGLIAAGLVDRVVFFYGPKLIGAGIPMARGRGRPLAEALTLVNTRVTALGPDWMVTADVGTSTVPKNADSPLPSGG